MGNLANADKWKIAFAILVSCETDELPEFIGDSPFEIGPIIPGGGGGGRGVTLFYLFRGQK